MTLRIGVALSAVHNGRIVALTHGEPIEADNVVLGMGVQPRSELAGRAGLTIVERANTRAAISRCAISQRWPADAPAA